MNVINFLCILMLLYIYYYWVMESKLCFSALFCMHVDTFFVLQLQQKQMRNGLARTLPKAWSPQHIAPYKARPQDLNETLSSSDTDSDEDV